MSAVIGYHCSHEQYAPSELLRNVKLATAAGFSAAMCSDHFNPWSERQGQSGYAWSWLGAALEATDASFGTVCAPGQRYHPAVIAHAAATLRELYGTRFWLALGSGEALNETITGEPWPDKAARNQRLGECVDIMRALWAGETVDRRGLVTVKNAKLYTRPSTPPPVFAACLSEETARWAGAWADGLITVTADRDQLRSVIDAFRSGGGSGKPMYLQVVMSFAPTDDEALEAAHHEWRQAALAPTELADLDSPAAFDRATSGIRHADVQKKIRISSSVQQHLEWLQGDVELGFERLFLHNVHRDQQRFVNVFADKVLPAFRR
jgi:coenzyme F420-dependent glucose-6-phosphate dehydrogenase